MPAARDDYLLRLITQAAAALRRLRERLGHGTADEVVRDAGAAIGALLGPQRDLLERLDVTSARAIVGNPDTVRAWSALLVLQADAELLRGQRQAAERLRARARALFPDVEQTGP